MHHPTVAISNIPALTNGVGLRSAPAIATRPLGMEIFHFFAGHERSKAPDASKTAPVKKSNKNKNQPR